MMCPRATAEGEAPARRPTLARSATTRCVCVRATCVCVRVRHVCVCACACLEPAGKEKAEVDSRLLWGSLSSLQVDSEAALCG